MLVTINTDASFLPDLKQGSFAFMICSNAGMFTKSGKLVNCTNPTFAELMCIANALHYTRNHPDLWGITKIIINTDCEAAIKMVKGYTKMMKKNKKYRQVVGKITNYIGKYKNSLKVEVEFRHVRAHTGKKDKRSKANEWCDKQAKKVLRK